MGADRSAAMAVAMAVVSLPQFISKMFLLKINIMKS
jgi:hypothetical protein